jgi:hypothetical protein
MEGVQWNAEHQHIPAKFATGAISLVVSKFCSILEARMRAKNAGPPENRKKPSNRLECTHLIPAIIIISQSTVHAPIEEVIVD